MKHFYLTYLMLFSLALPSAAQLHWKNPSFEALGAKADVSQIDDTILHWHYCTNYPDSNERGFKWHDTSIYTPPVYGKASDGYFFIELVGRSYFVYKGTVLYPDAVRETVSSSLKCQMQKVNHRYRMSIDLRTNYGTPYGIPYIYIYMGKDTCDTLNAVYENYVSDTGWRKTFFSFEAKSNWDHLSLRCRHMYKDTTTFIGREHVQMYFDNLSPLSPDTAYNSEHFPILVSAKGLGEYSLRSPYIGEQYWYQGATLLGSGDSIAVSVKQTTTYTLVLGKDSCIPSVLQTTIKVETDPGFGTQLLFPNAFTPNGDARNEGFRVIQNTGLAGLQQYELSVYNRWGQRLWQSTDPAQAWTGVDAGTGVYFWLCRYTLPNGSRQQQKGDVTLLR